MNVPLKFPAALQSAMIEHAYYCTPFSLVYPSHIPYLTYPMAKLPAYDNLPIDRTKAPDSSAWGVFGENDNLGTLNLLTEERVAKVHTFIYDD